MTRATANGTAPPPRRLPPEEFELKELVLHGHRVAYRCAGSGPAIVLVHGITSNSATWERVMPYLATRFTVIAPDLIGHGESAKPRGDYSLGAYASGVRDLMVTLGHESATFIGHSLGGGIVMQLAYQFPERCERLVLVDSGGLGREVSLLLRAATLPLSEVVLPLLASTHLLDAGRAVSRLFGRVGLHAGTDMAELGRGHASLADPEARAAFINTLRTIVDPGGQRVNASDRLYLAENIPFLLVWGERDPIIPVEHGLRRARARALQPARDLRGSRSFPAHGRPAAIPRRAARLHRLDRARGAGSGELEGHAEVRAPQLALRERLRQLAGDRGGRARIAATSACVEGRAASAARVTAKIARPTGSSAIARSATPGRRPGRTRSGSSVTASPRATSARLIVASLVRWRMSGSKPPCSRHVRWVISSQPIPGVAGRPRLAGELGERHGVPVPARGGCRAGRTRCTGSREQFVALQARGQPPRLVLPLVAEHEVDVAERQRGQRLLGLGLDQLAAQPRRVARERLDRRQREAQRDGLERGDPPASRDGAGGRGEVRLGERRALEQRIGVADEHERRVGQAHAAAGALEQAHAGLALEHRELLRDGRRRELQRVGDRGDRPALVQLAEQAQAAQVEHCIATLPNLITNRNRS